MIGLLALGFIALAVWSAKAGWDSYRSRSPYCGRTLVEVAGFLGFAALLAALVFCASGAAFMGQRIYIFVFWAGMAVINIGALSLLALVVRVIPRHGVFVSDALRVSAVFFIVYFLAFADSLMKLFQIRKYF